MILPITRQLYLPPESSINKDFLKLVLIDEKKLLERQKVKTVEVPMYDELSVSNIWPLMKENKEFMQYFPDHFAKGRLPAR